MKSVRNFNSSWAKILINEQPTSLAKIKPGNFYKVLLYKYSDGQTKALSGPNTSYIFLLGKFNKDSKDYISAVKLKSVDPKVFFNDIRMAFGNYPLTEEKIDKAYENVDDISNDEFSRLLKKIQLDGKNIFSIIKTKKQTYDGYREYIVKNIKNMSYVDIDPEFLKKIITSKSKSTKNLKEINKALTTAKPEPIRKEIELGEDKMETKK